MTVRIYNKRDIQSPSITRVEVRDISVLHKPLTLLNHLKGLRDRLVYQEQTLSGLKLEDKAKLQVHRKGLRAEIQSIAAMIADIEGGRYDTASYSHWFTHTNN